VDTARKGQFVPRKQANTLRFAAGQFKGHHDVGNQECMFEEEPVRRIVLSTNLKISDICTRFLFQE
jgi:hypothetical protein